MTPAPRFLDGDDPAQWASGQVFRGARANRRSEAFAWSLALGFAVLAAAGRWRGVGPAPLSAELAAFFGLIGLWISIGKWIDRRTAIEVSDGGVRYQSPLRVISLGWSDIDELWAIPSGSSWRIVVRGREHRFGFRTSSVLRVGKRSMEFGYPEGERLAGLIRRRSGLGRPRGSDGEWVCTRSSDVSAEGAVPAGASSETERDERASGG